MDANLGDIEKILAQAKKQQNVCKRKQQLEGILANLSICQNVGACYKKAKTFGTKVLKVNCEVVTGVGHSEQRLSHTLIITVKNVSKDIPFKCEHWKFRIITNHDRTHSVWSLEKDLLPGQIEVFSCPLRRSFYVEKVKISLEFVLQFESHMYTRSFTLDELFIDALNCLDTGRNIYETSPTPAPDDASLVDSILKGESTVTFQPITQIIFKVNPTLRDDFIRNIFLCDSLHRGFNDSPESLKGMSELTVYFLGNKIDLIVKKDYVAVRCGNPQILCAVKVAILRRLFKLDGITVESLDEQNIEQLHALRLNVNAIESTSVHDNISEYYLKLRDISESIVFSLAHVLD